MKYNKLFEQIIYKSMPTNELIFEGAKNISNFVDELKAMTVGLDKFDETTKRGDYHLNKLSVICTNINHINKAMEDKVKVKEKINKDDIEAIIEGIDKTDTPSVLSILGIVFKKREKRENGEEIYDNEDKANIHKACQAYDQLVGQFRHYLNQLKLIAENIAIKPLNPPLFNMEVKSAFKAIDTDIDAYINSLNQQKKSANTTTK
jgi:hypothetical protein